MKSSWILPLLMAAATAGATNSMSWRAQFGSTAEARDHVKSQPSSQLWKWSPGGKLEIKFQPVTVPARNGAFGMWFFNETPHKGRLNLEFFNGRKSVGKAWYNLNFRYWRPLGGYFADLDVKPGTRIDRIVLTAPSEAGSARVDEVRPAYVTRFWYADSAQPWIGKKELLRASPEKTVFSTHDISLNRPYLPSFVPEKEIPEKEMKDVQRLTEYFPRHAIFNAPLPCAKVDDLEKEIDAIGIREDGSGPAMEFGGIPLAVPNANKGKMLSLFRKVSYLLMRTKGADRERTAKLGVRLCRYMIMQGYNEGNGNTGWPGNGYGFRVWPPVINMLRNDLKKAGLLEEMAKATAWLAGGNAMMSEAPHGNCDFYLNYTSHLPLCISLIEDPAERYQRFRALKRFYDVSIATQYPFGDDGTIHHHGGHHPAYGSYTIPGLLNSQLIPLHGTAFAISEASRNKLYNHAYALNFQIDHNRTPINLPMRAGARLNLDGSGIALFLSRMDSPDRRMARLYLTALGDRKTKDGDRFRAEGLTPLPLEGHRTFNLAALAVHRRGNIVSTAAGMISCYRGLEIYGWMESNNYGRHSRNGSLFISVDGNDGFQPEGWNWNHIPAASNVIHKPTDIFEGYTFYGNGSNFAGGVTIPGGNGVWGMDFTGNDVNFKQGIFFFDDRITVTVSNLIKRSPRPPKATAGDAVTTLFQQTPGKNGVTAWREGNLLGDNLGNGYIIWKGAPHVQFQTGKQSWTYFYKRYLKDPADNPLKEIRGKRFREPKLEDNAKYYKPTEGEFSLAYINHGANPQGRGCSYTILTNADKAKVKTFAADPQMKVLRADRIVHAVRDNRTKTTGYVVFASGAYPKPLESISRPAFLAVKDLGDAYELSVSISDPKDRSPLTVKLTGAAPVKVDPLYPAGNTIRVPKK